MNPFFGPIMQLGFQQGFGASPYANVRGKRVSGYQGGYSGAQQQQQFANQGMYDRPMGPGTNVASFLNRLAFQQGGQGGRY